MPAALADKKAARGAEAKPDRLFVESVARAFRVLEAFADAPEPKTLSQIAAAAGIDKSAAQRLSHTLSQLGYLEQGQGGLVPGRRLLERSFDYLRANPLVGRAIPIVSELRRNVQERVDLSLFDGLTMLYLARLQSKRDTFYGYLSGRRVPTYCTAGGRAVLSRLPREEALDILRRCDRQKMTAHTIVDVRQIMAQVDAARTAGYALAAEQLHVGEVVVAAPIMDKQGRPAGAIHVSGSLAEWQPDAFEGRIAPLVVAAATAVSAG